VRAWVLAALLLATSAQAEVLNQHDVVLDQSGKLQSWLPEERALAEVQRLAWRWLLHDVPRDPKSGLQLYFLYPFLDDPATLAGVNWTHNPASLFATLEEGAERWYAFSGDTSVAAGVREALDYDLAHGLTPVGWSWARVPYASSAAGATEYGGTDIAGPGGPGDGVGVIEPDKVGELGYALVRFYELTGETRYRDAAIVCADALAAHVSAGDDTHSPWPFRAFAESGAVVEDYTAHVIGPLHLLDELIRLGVGDTARYRTARDLAFRWLLAYAWPCR